MKYWIRTVILAVTISILVSYALDAVFHSLVPVIPENEISSSIFNITEPIGILVAVIIIILFRPTNDQDMVHYHLIKKILLALTVVSAVYGISNELLRVFGSNASPFLIIFVLYTKNIAMVLTIIFVYQKFKPSSRS